ETEEESPFLRAQKRVPVRRAPLPRKTAHLLKKAVLAFLLLGVVGWAGAVVYAYGTSSWRFRLDSRDSVQIEGMENVSPEQVTEVFRPDVGRNLFQISLDDRRKSLEQIPWIESAAVMRLLPDRLQVSLRERKPVAFAQIGSRVSLIDANGVVMEMPTGRQKQYSFPVVVGMGESEPRSTRAARMKIYSTLVGALDGEGGRYSEDLSEVDLSDPEDVKITVADPAGAVLVHLGSSHFLERYKVYLAHVGEWRQQFQRLDSVDLRYERQIIVNPDPRRMQSVTPAAKPAATAGTRTVARRTTPKSKATRKKR
ncbi:MAG: FtsQ-type POTRA domain-containing protein, partial [Acidobacteria bacterium]|nr:FtsQ-type POTRA domain-containing protein [Acidobacteriota bacterium]